MTYTVTEESTVKLNDVVQESEDGTYTLNLTTSAQTLTITSKDKKIVNNYTFKLVQRSSYAVPTNVIDYLCINSQYTNNSYGLQPETTLSGGLKSLGSFGGYITYKYDTPLTDNANNLYGIDFYVYGNAYAEEGGTGMSFFEPGQVWVSEDGDQWYALAGSAHYDDGVDWDYSVTYTKTASGKTAWTDSQGNSNSGTSCVGTWPTSSNYYLNKLVGSDSITLSGILLPASNGASAIIGEAVEAYPVNWGYVDCFPNGNIGADVNPYTDNSDHKLKANGFDLAWAVDEDGLPVDVSNMQFYYVKVQTASNIWCPGINEKSTEVSYVVRTTDSGADVGTTAAPTGITVTDGADTKTLNFSGEQQVYTLDIGDMKYVSLSVNGAGSGDNIYVNNQRISTDGEAQGIKVTGEKLVRVLVQNGDSAPVIRVIKLTSSATDSDTAIDGVKVNVSGTARTASTTDGKTYTLSVGHRIDSVGIVPVTAEGYTVNGDTPADSYSLSYGENTFVIRAGDESVTLKITREAAPTSSSTITVYFTLLGDEIHGESGTTHTYSQTAGQLQTWISRTSFTVKSTDTVLDVMTTALDKAGLSYTNAGGNYISAINGLSEFSNGSKSGWMYTINGVYPSLGVAEQSLKNGDVIVFHYTDDYSQEQSAPTNTGSSGSSNSSAATTPTTPTDVTLTPSVTVSEGIASAAVSTADVTSAIGSAKETDADALVIAPEVKGEADSVSVTLPQEAVSNLADKSDLSLTLSTDLADVTLPNESLSDLKSGDVTITAQAGEDGAVVIDVTSGGETVDTLSGGLSVTIPAEETSSSTVLVLVSEDGTETILKKSLADEDSVSALLEGSATVKVTDNAKTFSDVGDAWYADAVAFAASRELFNGTSATTFSPQKDMTRAMFVTVLYRLEDAVAQGDNAFSDVAADTWYTDAVIWGSENGLVTGTGSGFSPTKSVTREQMATFLYRYANFLGMDTSAGGDLTQFQDGDKTSSWAETALQWAVGTGLISGKSSTTLDPTGTATRAEVATILQRMVGIMVK